MLKKRVGILSTRTPHRPNPIGITLTRLDRIEGRTLYLSAVDLVEGTPVVDIKPYIPYYDCLGEGGGGVPPWIADTITSRKQVNVKETARMSAMELAGEMEHYYNDAKSFLQAVVEVLAADVRSDHQKEKVEVVYSRCMDTLLVDYVVESGGECVTVLDVRRLMSPLLTSSLNMKSNIADK